MRHYPALKIAMRCRILIFALVTFLGAVPAQGVTLPQLFADHMVIQRNHPVHVYGHGDPNETVTVSFRDASATDTVDAMGNWSVDLPPGEAGGPFTMTIAGKDRIEISDVLVGDVWVASGQSNMEFEVRQLDDAANILAQSADDQLRIVKIEKKPSTFVRWDAVNYGWHAAGAQSLPDFSAVAYFFARELREREHVPIGVIESSWGGTPAESWTSLTALSSDAALMPVFASRARMVTNHERDQQTAVVEAATIANAKKNNQPVPQYPWHPPLESWAPGELYNSMIAPLTNSAIRGVIWYQGEANTALDRAPSYAHLLQTMITDWRKQWGEGDFAFLVVQISNFKSTSLEDWAMVREAQRQALHLKSTGLAVTIDIGNPDDVHPHDKRTVGHRLALAARHIAYQEQLEYSGPAVREAALQGDAAVIWFDHATGGLHAKGDQLTGFEVAGENGVFVPANVTIVGTSLEVRAPGVTRPNFVRYGWANSPVCNLYNGEGLPASPFTVTIHPR